MFVVLCIILRFPFPLVITTWVSMIVFGHHSIEAYRMAVEFGFFSKAYCTKGLNGCETFSSRSSAG